VAPAVGQAPAAPRIETLRVHNYRALRDINVSDITPLTVLVGPNGSGKSTVFDVFAFLAECFSEGLRRAWDRRGRFKQLRTRGAEGPITVEVQYRERPDRPIITYHLEIDETSRGPIVAREWLRWKRGRYGAPFYFLNYERGAGKVISGDAPDAKDTRVDYPLTSPDVLAVNTLGQLAANPRVQALRDFIVGWHLSYLSTAATRGNPEAGAQEKLSQTGDNLPNVIQHLREQHPDRLENIFGVLRQRVPRLDKFDAEILTDGRLLLTLKDAPFDEPVLARYASDGTMKLLAYLIQLYDPEPPPLIGIEEPENFLHPRLLPELAEECEIAAGRTQLIVTTHSPFFVDRLRPEEVRVIYRDESGYSQIQRVAEMPGIKEFLSAGATLGDLWMEGHFSVGDPLKT
jgi:predicted ATPase